MMDIRYPHGPAETSRMDTEALRAHYLVPALFAPGELHLTYTLWDRLILGGVLPVGSPVPLPSEPELRSAFFLERREMGVINVGGDGTVSADGLAFGVKKLEAVYLGRGTREVTFSSADPGFPARFFLLSAPAHQAFPNAFCARGQAAPVQMGTSDQANCRTIYKYIHEQGMQSAQLVMGLTVLEAGSVWNTMPAHTHSRRTEVYFYFDLGPGDRVFHLMGEPGETRHVVVADQEAVVSPPWSIHSGCGTSRYGFIWGMAGENRAYSDMDSVPIDGLR